MRLPLELEHLIKSADLTGTATNATDPATPNPATPNPATDPKDPKPLTARLEAIEARKALEVEHYLRACALRLDLDEPGAAAHAGD